MNYTSVYVDKVDLVGNYERTVQHKWGWMLSQMGKPVNKLLWAFPPQDINAFFSPTDNRCTFLAALLQPPFFFPTGDMALNFGSIGAVIGHEMTHGFDDEGRKYNAKGKL